MSIRFPVANPQLNARSIANVEDCVASHWISSSGAYIQSFESGFAERFGPGHAITCSNGTMAIELALTALGIGAGDEVIVPNFTFVGSVSPIYRVHAIPVLAPPASTSWNVDPEAVEALISPKTKAIIAVHLYGHPCDILSLKNIADQHGLALIEDCAEALGATFDGKNIGTFGDVGCYSFFGNKVLTTGEGGMCITQSAELAEKIMIQKNHGMRPTERYWHRVIGHNGRMTNLQAAVGAGQLITIDEDLKRRQEIEDQYMKHLLPSGFFRDIAPVANTKTVNWLTSPVLKSNRGLDRDHILSELKTKGVDSRPFFYPITCMPAFSRFGHHDERSHDIAAHGMNLPTYLSLSEENVYTISKTLIHACQHSEMKHGPNTFSLQLPQDLSTLHEPEVSLVVPTLNAGFEILGLIAEARRQFVACNVLGEILIMDDQSDDGAPHLIRERYAHDPSVKLITRQAPKSMGDALREGFLAAKGHTIIFMDGNGNHDPMLLGNMIQNRHDYQAISGSRFATGGHCLNPYKHVLSQNFNRWVRLCLGLPTRDNTSGYLCFQKEALNQLHPETALQHGPTYGLHLMFMAQKCGLSILELPTRSRQSFPNPFKKRPWNRLKGYCSTVVKLTLSRFGWC